MLAVALVAVVTVVFALIARGRTSRRSPRCTARCCFTAALAAHLLGLHRMLRIALWVLFVVSANATVHLGWHYVIDDIAGIAIALLALGLACYMTGFQGRDRQVPAAK